MGYHMQILIFCLSIVKLYPTSHGLGGFFLPKNAYAFLRGLWTWPTWVICAPACNHKIGNAAHSGVSEVLLFVKSYQWKQRRWKKWATGRILLDAMLLWRSPTVRQFKMAVRRMWAQQKLKLLNEAWQCPNYSLPMLLQCSLLFPCSISSAENFVTCLLNKAYVYYYYYYYYYYNPKLKEAWFGNNVKRTCPISLHLNSKYIKVYTQKNRESG